MTLTPSVKNVANIHLLLNFSANKCLITKKKGGIVMNTIDSTRICFTLLKIDFIPRLIIIHRLLQQQEHRQVANELIEFWRQDQANPPTGDIIVLLTEPSDEAKITAIHAYLNSTYHNNEDQMRLEQVQLNSFINYIKTDPIIHNPLVNAYKLLVTTKHFFLSQNIALSITYIGACIAYFIDQFNLLNVLTLSPRLFQLVYDQNPEDYRQQQIEIFNEIQNDLINYLEDINTKLREETWILDRQRFLFSQSSTLQQINTTVNSLEQTTQTLIDYWKLKLLPRQEHPYRPPNEQLSIVPLCHGHYRKIH